MSWACQRSSYNGWFRPRQLPCAGQFSRRVRSPRVEAILNGVHARLSRMEDLTPVLYLDGRALLVSHYSKDREARTGPAPGGFGRGYKLHAMVTQDRRVPVWSVMPLNVSEKVVAAELVDWTRPSGLVLADGFYDSGTLYDQVSSYGGHLLTPLPQNAGRGHHRQSSARLAAALAWKGVAGYVFRDRIHVEGCFGNQSSFGGGLGPLPAWVRTLPRVRRWVGAKLTIYHARLHLRKAVA